MNARYHFSILLLLSIVLFFFKLGSISVFQVAEARNAECAREMYQHHDWIVPTFNGQLRGDKPVLEYYAMIIAYHLMGVSEWSARFFSAVCGLFTIIFTYFFVKKNCGKKIAWYSAVILLASVHTIVQFRLATPDPYLILFHVTALYCFYEGWKNKKWKWMAVMYLLLGLAMLAKGPVGVILPVLTIFSFLLFKRKINWQAIAIMKPWWGILLFLAVSAPWYILVHIKTNGQWTKTFFWEHNINRFDAAVNNHGGIFLITFLFVFAGMIPFSIFCVRAFANAWKKLKTNDLLLFSFFSFAVIVIFYACSRTKLFNYTVPAYPFLAIIIAYYLNELIADKIKWKKIKPEQIIIFIISLAVPVGIYFWAINTEPLTHLGWVGWYFILLPCGTFAALFLLKKNIEKSLLLIAGSYIITTILIFAVPYPAIDAQNPMRKRQVLISNKKNVIAYKSFNDAFVFYVRHPVKIIEDKTSLQQYLVAYDSVLVLTRSAYLNELKNMSQLQLVSDDRDLFSYQYSVIFKKE